MIGSTCKTIARQVTSLKRMIDDLLDVSRLAKQNWCSTSEPVVLGELLRNAVDDVQILAAEYRHELTLDVDPTSDVLLDADPVRLVQVFVNLLTNAAKYTEPGGKIWLTSRLEGAEAVVRIRGHRRGHRRRDARSGLRPLHPGRPLADQGGRAGWASAWPWCATWSTCTAGASTSGATAPAREANSPCGFPCFPRKIGSEAGRRRCVGNPRGARPADLDRRGQRRCRGSLGTVVETRGPRDVGRSRRPDGSDDGPRTPARRGRARHRTSRHERLRGRRRSSNANPTPC